MQYGDGTTVRTGDIVMGNCPDLRAEAQNQILGTVVEMWEKPDGGGSWLGVSASNVVYYPGKGRSMVLPLSGVHRMPLGSARLVAANNPAGE